MMHKIISSVTSFLCRNTCIFCNDLTRRNLDLCHACESDFPFLSLTNHCVRCARLLPDGQEICGSCISSFLPEIKTIALFNYDTPISQLIINLKFRNNLVNAKILGTLFSEQLDQRYQNKIKPEVIIPVPLHPVRLRERGYNQALELAKPIAKKLNISINKFGVKRLKNTAAQTQLSALARKKNVKRAFGVVGDFNYNYVAIVDDVVTSGSTVFELSKTLYKAGVTKIDIWCCAKS